MDIKTLYAFQQDVRAYADNLIYGVRLQMDVGDGALNFEFSIVPMKLNYGDIISFPNKFKFEHINIFANLLILEQKNINTWPSETLISLKSHF